MIPSPFVIRAGRRATLATSPFSIRVIQRVNPRPAQTVNLLEFWISLPQPRERRSCFPYTYTQEEKKKNDASTRVTRDLFQCRKETVVVNPMLQHNHCHGGREPGREAFLASWRKTYSSASPSYLLPPLPLLLRILSRPIILPRIQDLGYAARRMAAQQNQHRCHLLVFLLLFFLSPLVTCPVFTTAAWMSINLFMQAPYTRFSFPCPVGLQSFAILAIHHYQTERFPSPFSFSTSSQGRQR